MTTTMTAMTTTTTTTTTTRRWRHTFDFSRISTRHGRFVSRWHWPHDDRRMPTRVSFQQWINDFRPTAVNLVDFLWHCFDKSRTRRSRVTTPQRSSYPANETLSATVEQIIIIGGEEKRGEGGICCAERYGDLRSRRVATHYWKQRHRQHRRWGHVCK